MNKMKIPVRVTSNISSRTVEGTISPRKLLDLCDESELIIELTKCNCQPIGETNVVDCNCDEEWYDCEVFIGDEIQ